MRVRFLLEYATAFVTILPVRRRFLIVLPARQLFCQPKFGFYGYRYEFVIILPESRLFLTILLTIGCFLSILPAE